MRCPNSRGQVCKKELKTIHNGFSGIETAVIKVWEKRDVIVVRSSRVCERWIFDFWYQMKKTLKVPRVIWRIAKQLCEDSREDERDSGW